MRASGALRKNIVNCSLRSNAGAVKDKIEKYGYLWPGNLANDLNIELACYSERQKFCRSELSRDAHMKNAFRIVWPNFEWNEWVEKIIWAWCHYRVVSVIGCTSSGKSFGTAHCALLDYLAKPRITSTTFTTTKFDALRTRIWGDVMSAIETSILKESIIALFKPTTTSNELKLGLRQKDVVDSDKFQMQGVATDSADTTASKIRGQHTDRRRIIGDECEDMGEAIYTAITNARVAPDFIAVLLTNPALKQSIFGSKWACPKNGWGSVNENDDMWETVQPDGICIHFNGLHSPNMRAKRVVAPYLITPKYIEDIRVTEGENSLKWWMFVLGFPAPDGLVGLIWSTSTLEKAKQTVLFDYPPTPCAALDPAFDFDDCVIHLGEYGMLRNGKPCLQGKKSVKIKIEVGKDRLEKEEQVADETIRLCKEWGVKPEDFVMDGTGNARGTYALLRTKWSPRVQAIYYGGEATERPLRLNDPMDACDQVKYFVSELWFRASYLAREGHLCGLGNLAPRTVEDLAGRRYELKQFGDRKLMIAESKTIYKARLGHSPDYGDAYTEFGELMVRKGLLAGIAKGASPSGWDHLRKIAQKAGARFNEEPANVQA